nr:MAG TPA: hypothetical protein [Caudoviricetes sp.]
METILPHSHSHIHFGRRLFYGSRPRTFSFLKSSQLYLLFCPYL